MSKPKSQIENHNEKGTYPTFTMSRNYKDKEGKWKNAQSFRATDLPVLEMLLREAFKQEKLKTHDSTADEELTP